jgi:hypothetical protein
LAAGAGITLTETNDGGDEDVTIGFDGDASEVTYTPNDAGDWDAGDPGDVDDALDELAQRAIDLETGGVYLLYSQTVDETVANTTSESDLMLAGRGSKTIPANELAVGSVLRLSATGVVSNTSTPTLNIKVTLGGTTICSTGAFTTASGMSNHGWRLEVELVCRVTGGSGTGEVIGGGTFEYGDGNQHDVGGGNPTVDTTAANELMITATWGTADASNTITCETAVIEHLNPENLALVGPSGLTATETV